ncbi:hypothetical protein Sm713_53790 [Streptomyces sp. TS71-3]|nr:hypothetical protein Sm713_53790 [Streptomyces sp. TS71-3]
MMNNRPAHDTIGKDDRVRQTVPARTRGPACGCDRTVPGPRRDGFGSESGGGAGPDGFGTGFGTGSGRVRGPISDSFRAYPSVSNVDGLGLRTSMRNVKSQERTWNRTLAQQQFTEARLRVHPGPTGSRA